MQNRNFKTKSYSGSSDQDEEEREELLPADGRSEDQEDCCKPIKGIRYSTPDKVGVGV